MSSARVASVRPIDGSAQLVVDEHGAVAAVPVERDEPVGADRLLGGELGELLVDVEPASRRVVVVLGRHLPLDEPGEDVADAALAGLVAEQAGRDAAVDDAAHPRHLRERRPFMTWHVDVPMTASMCPGSIARAAGAVTCASTFPTATAMPSGRPHCDAAAAVSVPARPPSGDSGSSSLSTAKRRRMGGAPRGSRSTDTARPGTGPCSPRCTRCASRRRRAARRSSRRPRSSGRRPRTQRGPPRAPAAPSRAATRRRCGRRTARATARRARPRPR